MSKFRVEAGYLSFTQSSQHQVRSQIYQYHSVLPHPTLCSHVLPKPSGKIMIADLQGVRYNDPFDLNSGSYVLTNPSILSATHGGEYGSTDTGVEGISMFLINHNCNDVCKNFRMPYLADMKQHLYDSTAYKRRSIGMSTAYLKDNIFPENIRYYLIQALKKCYQSY